MPKNVLNTRGGTGYVQLCIVLLPGTTFTPQRVISQIREAHKVWSKGNYRMRFNYCITDFRNSNDISIPTTNDSNITGTSIPSPVMRELLNLRETRGVPINSILIYYTGAKGKNGFTALTILTSPAIFMTNAAFPQTLAHEIGHAFFASIPFLKGYDPDPNRDPKDPVHNRSRNNILYYAGSKSSKASASRRQIIEVFHADNPRLVFSSPNRLSGCGRFRCTISGRV